MTSKFSLRILGKTELQRRGIEVPLVKSRKTRALLTYLCIMEGPQAREELCELFFDRTSDPRGALRWSLSRIRNMFGDDGATVIRATRTSVELDLTEIELDLDFVIKTSSTLKPSSTNLIRSAAMLVRDPLAHCSLSYSPEFDEWLNSTTQKLLMLRGDIIQKILKDPDILDQTKYTWALLWARQLPNSFPANHAVYTCLNALDRKSEANQVKQAYLASNAMAASLWDAGPEMALCKNEKTPQIVQYCTAKEGFKIAYAKVGTGPPIVKTANWLNHLELDWDSPIWGETFEALSVENTLIRYDGRGNGMSEWDVDDISFDAFVDDLETVTDSLNLDRFPLLAMSQGCAVAIAFATRHPERVSSLVLVGGYAAGWRIGMTPEEIEQRDAVMTLTRHGWGTENPAYRRIFSQTFMPSADEKRLDWFDEFQRRTTSPENAVRFQEAFGDIDVRHLLDQVQAPTLVMHASNDQRIKIGHGRALAAGIPNAELVELDSQNHIILGDEPAWLPFINDVTRFLRKHAD